MGKKLAENSLVVLIGLVASIIAIYSFVTGIDNIAPLIFQQITQTPTFTITPVVTQKPVPINLFGEEGGIFWDSYKYDPFYNNISFWGMTRGDINGLSFSYMLVPYSTLQPNATPTEDPNFPSFNIDENAVYMKKINFDASDYCFVLVAGSAQVLVDDIEVISTNSNPGGLHLPPYYAKVHLDRGEYQVRINIYYPYIEYKSSEWRHFEFSWYKGDQIDCTTIGTKNLINGEIP